MKQRMDTNKMEWKVPVLLLAVINIGFLKKWDSGKLYGMMRLLPQTQVAF